MTDEPIAIAQAMASLCRPPPESTSGRSVRRSQETDAAEGILRAGENLGNGEQHVLEREGDLVEHGRRDDLRVRILEHHGDIGAQKRDRSRPSAASSHLDRAPHTRGNRLRQQAVEGESERGLPRPAGSEHQDDLARMDVEGDALRSLSLRTRAGDGEVMDAEQGNGFGHAEILGSTVGSS